MPVAMKIRDVYPDKATYRPGQRATVHVGLDNSGSTPFAGRLVAGLMHLASKRAEASVPVSVAAQEAITSDLVLELPSADFTGYGVDVRLLDERGSELAEASTGLDVLSDWALAPRYGFFADFAAGEADTAGRVAALARYHINVVQYYDWMWRHYALLPPSGQDEFVDGMGRRLSLTTVKNKISLAHGFNMAALAYGAVYGAEPEYFEAHRDWALFKADGAPEAIERLFYIMNIAPGSPWNDVIVNEYVRAVTELDFDGIHMDQYGFPKQAHLGGKDGPLIDVAAAFAPLIGQSAAAVAAARPGGQVIFNNVNDWPTSLTAPAHQAAVYIEVWPPNDTYFDLQRLIEDGKRAAGDQKRVILAAYITPLCLTRGDAEKTPQAEEAARLAAAAIFANGGFHLLMGEGDGALCDPYYPKYAPLRPEFAAVMRAYYDFFVRYENWLVDPRLAPLPAEAVGDQGAVRLESGKAYGGRPRQDATWVIARQAPGVLTLSLLNLAGQKNTLWNALHTAPEPQAEIPVILATAAPVKAVTLASPDRNGGRPQALAFEAEGDRVAFTIPHLDRWDLVIVELTR